MDPVSLTLMAVRVAALQSMCDKTRQILDDVIVDAKQNGHYGLAVASSHLQDSLQVFSSECERSILKDGSVK